MDTFMRNFKIFFMGGSGYFILELLYRGYSHWTMFLTGGIAFLCLFSLFTCHVCIPFWACCIAGSLIVTGIEFVVGIIVNTWLGWQIWDYSALPFNLLGQISLPFSIVWFVLCIPIGYLSRLFGRKIAKQTHIA